MKQLLLPALALLLLAQCKKADPDPVSALPPETQTGAGTFGCLLNGQPWTLQGNDGTSNYTLYYDPIYKGGNLGIKVYRLQNGFFQDIILGGDSIPSVGIYSLGKAPRSIFYFDSQKSMACQEYTGQQGQYRRGVLTITRLDRAAGIVSGTFAFTLYKPGCDSVRITQGRFDRKL